MFQPLGFYSCLFCTGQTSSSADENHFGFTEVNGIGFMRAAVKPACPWLAELNENVMFSSRQLGELVGWKGRSENHHNKEAELSSLSCANICITLAN